jgi:hypothetical protein
VLLFADHAAEAQTLANRWLELAQRQGSEPAAATAAGFLSLLALYGGEVSDAVAFGQQGIAGTPNIWISTITSSFVVRALVERSELAAGGSLLDRLGRGPHGRRRRPAEGRRASGAVGHPEPGDLAMALRRGTLAASAR